MNNRLIQICVPRHWAHLPRTHADYSKAYVVLRNAFISHCNSRIDHAEKLHELPDEYLADVGPIAKKIAIATGAVDYNLLQNNGRNAHQVFRFDDPILGDDC